jgi:anti-sigma-K factor RskA
MVFSASRLPPPPPESTYQIWLLSGAGPVSAGLFAPDQAGRFTLATDVSPQAPPPVTGVTVTIEPAGGGKRPTGLTLLARAQ